MIPARVSCVFLGARDMARMRGFYRQLGWREQAASNDNHSMFHTGGAVLGLLPIESLPDEANVDASSVELVGLAPGSRGNTTAINLESREAVDAAFEHLKTIGADIPKPPQEVFWGGYSGYFADPEGNLWEVAYNPFVSFDERGALILGD